MHGVEDNCGHLPSLLYFPITIANIRNFIEDLFIECIEDVKRQQDENDRKTS